VFASICSAGKQILGASSTARLAAVLGIGICLSGCPFTLAQETKNAARYAELTDKLQSLTKIPLSGCWQHADVVHPESASLDDSTWTRVAVGAKFESGVHVLRCQFKAPRDLNGYNLTGTSLRVAFDLQGDGMTMLSVFSNGYNVYRGNADTLEPILLTASAQPDEQFVIAVRLEVGDQPRTLSRSEILIEPRAGRPDPELLRLEILSLQPILTSYPSDERQKQLDLAVGAIDFSKLQAGNQSGFDDSLKMAQDELQVLQPWIKQFRIRAVGNSHIDMAWLWPWTETVETVRNTFRSALNMMNEYPDFTYSASTARAYEWMEEKYPSLFQEIQQRVKEGRWEIVGGMWVEPDLNMPSGESLTRQILIGKQYFKKKFNVDVRVGWNPDSFGYNWQLPQIYKKSGIDYFVTAKLQWAHEFTTFPYKYFWWEAPDGSRLLTYFPHDYGSLMEPVVMAGDVAEWIPSTYHNGDKSPGMMYLYGVGDHGGGPTRTMLDQAMRLMQPDAVYPKVEFSTAASFFSDLDKQKELAIPVWKNELYFQYHRGVFTTQAETKKRIRQTEETLLDAERFASLAQLYGRQYPHEQLTSAWKALLFDQFHDIMPGSGIAVNYLDAQRDLDAAERSSREILNRSLEEISARIDTQQKGTPVVVYNSMSWSREEIVEATVQLPARATGIEVVDSKGKLVRSQILANEPNTGRITFLMQARAPALGYATFFVRSAASSAPVTSVLKASADGLENEFIQLKVNSSTGCITSIVEKKSKREMLAPSASDTGGPTDGACGNLLQVFVDKPKEYDAWNIDADFEKQYWSLDHADSVELTEFGPLRSVIRVRHHFQNSSFTQDIILYAGASRIDVKMQTEWHEKHILLKAAFPISVRSRKATFEIPFGSIERPTTRNTPEEKAQFEVPAEHWADLSDSEHGVSILNDSKYGYDAKENVLRLSLLRSPAWPDPHADEGHHEFTYSIYPHSGNWREAETVRAGYNLNYKLEAVQVLNHDGSLPPEHSFLGLSSQSVVLTAAKGSADENENNDFLVLRFYEWAGKDSDVTLQLPAGVQSAWETNLIEQPIGKLALSKGTLTVHCKPFEIKTVKVKISTNSRN